MAQLWGGRFTKETDQLVYQFNASITFDKRFYKEDSSRNREAGGSGIGLSLVKAIMDNYKNEYGVINKYNGVEFYFELNKI